jgi:hypothetical protein
MDALRVFPENADRIKVAAGIAILQKKDIFKNLMWYSFEKSNTLYPLTIERVNEIVSLNKQGIFPEELQAVEVVRKNSPQEKTDFVDVVGQFSLKSLERNSKKKKKKARQQQQRLSGTQSAKRDHSPANKEVGSSQNKPPQSRNRRPRPTNRKKPKNKPGQHEDKPML